MNDETTTPSTSGVGLVHFTSPWDEISYAQQWDESFQWAGSKKVSHVNKVDVNNDAEKLTNHLRTVPWKVVVQSINDILAELYKLRELHYTDKEPHNPVDSINLSRKYFI